MGLGGEVEGAVEGVKTLCHRKGIGHADTRTPEAVVGVAWQGAILVVVDGTVTVDSEDGVDGLLVEGDGVGRVVGTLEESSRADCYIRDDARGACVGDLLHGTVIGLHGAVVGEELDAGAWHTAADATHLGAAEIVSFDHRNDDIKLKNAFALNSCQSAR